MRSIWHQEYRNHRLHDSTDPAYQGKAGWRRAIAVAGASWLVACAIAIAGPSLSMASPGPGSDVATSGPVAKAPVGGAPTGDPVLSGNLPHDFLGNSTQSTSTPGGEATPDYEAVCSQVTHFFNKFGATEVNGEISTICTKPEKQAVEICIQQYYSGSWHSSETCKRDPAAGTVDTSTLTDEGARWLRCTSGRRFRIWSWFYTPEADLNPVTEEFVPDGAGEARC